ncbi:hypothetical protein LF1_02870 [Rubripirellula obstinata]|uniref:Uncharacterized protein n=1 Tax=Rubripirellula obstinata TaxID=406547 RepID=A0A5B1C9I5_9BACT|nr:DUF4345 domain-containing protein [Rubripirellula obstinata]KAA1257797.1 hypothetical protein LF1_02870 [Rubripirellula obstinata]
MPNLTTSPPGQRQPSQFNNRDQQRLILLLRLIALVTFLAFAAAVMPSHWIREASEFLGFDPFPESPLTFYLARHLSLLYGFVGVLLWIAASDFDRYRPLVRKLGVLTIVFGVLQAIIDVMSGLPGWWSVGESISTVAGGGLLMWMERRVGDC